MTTTSRNGLATIEPAQVYPAGAGAPALALIDVRAPVEVARSALPGAVSLPILTDSERQQVGTCYREHGQDAAITLGLQLTAPHREARVAAWQQAIAASGGAVAFACWRGGQRSRIAQQWLSDERVPRVAGGTKALRRFLMTQLQAHFEATSAVVISGLTGCGKTEVLHRLAGIAPKRVLALDLEGLANHRGSAFGGFPEGQPAQQTFENQLAATMHLAKPQLTLLEDEARNVGRLEVPAYVWSQTKQSPVVMVMATQAERIARIARDYVFAPTRAATRAAVRENLEFNLNKLAKRLGGVGLAQCLEALAYADHDERWFDVAAHEPWIETLLNYYDKFYESAMTRLARPVLFAGCADDVVQWFAQHGFAL